MSNIRCYKINQIQFISNFRMASSVPLQELITCSICLEVYNNPQSLKCRHVYCHDCIQQLTQHSLIQCPDCRECCFIHDLKKDFRTQTLVDEYSQTSNRLKTVSGDSGAIRVCDICKESKKAAKSFCQTCNEYLCIDCDRAHRGSKMTRRHNLADFMQILKEKQRDIEKEIKKLQNKRRNVYQNNTSADSFVRHLQESKGKLRAEVNKYRNEIKMRVDEHHDGLIDVINFTIDSLLETVKQTKPLIAKCDTQIEGKIRFLSGVSSGQDYSLITDTLANLSQQIEKDLQQIDRELPKLDSCTTCPVSVLKGEEWRPQTSTQIKVVHRLMEQIKKLIPQREVGDKCYMAKLHNEISQSIHICLYGCLELFVLICLKCKKY